MTRVLLICGIVVFIANVIGAFVYNNLVAHVFLYIIVFFAGTFYGRSLERGK